MCWLADLAVKNKAQWMKVWKAVGELDLDKNGFLCLQEFDSVLRENFPKALAGRSLVSLMRKYGLASDPDFINYRKMKEEIMELFHGAIL